MNPRQMQQMAMQMQRQMAKIQEELKTVEVVGSAGSYITVTANGHGEIQAIKIDPQIVDPSDIETLQDLLLTAVNDAASKAKAVSESRMSAVTGGMKIPGLM
ncbi:MAG: YbaB/EbfC family nucleoid-associated protein [Chloroflexia bacterium]|nr:YbaB/EbfC family nucleoid-associated protein [Chloroflexia bacterium]